MLVSLNELDTMTRKAFRGAGYHWGEAEEAGKAATWLARCGLPVLPPVLHLLKEAQSHLSAMRPVREGQTLRAAGGLLCPVLAGIATSDATGELTAGQAIHYGRLCCPVLIAPFIAAAADALLLRLVFASPAGNIEARPNACAVHMRTDALEASSGSLVAHASGVAMAGTRPPREHMLPVEPGQWEALNAFAARTYVPATAQSRLSGAGAGVRDED